MVSNDQRKFQKILEYIEGLFKKLKLRAQEWLFVSWATHFLFAINSYGNSGCVGSCAKTSSDAVVDRSSRKHSSRRVLHRYSTSHREWWATSSDEMENNIGNSRSSQRSTSSISGTSHNQESRISNNNTNNTAFVNHALLLWQERRREWVGNRQEQRPQETREPVVTWTTTYDDLLATSRPFPRSIPLPEMVDFLVVVWEQEGLYENLC